MRVQILRDVQDSQEDELKRGLFVSYTARRTLAYLVDMMFNLQDGCFYTKQLS